MRPAFCSAVNRMVSSVIAESVDDQR